MTLKAIYQDSIDDLIVLETGPRGTSTDALRLVLDQEGAVSVVKTTLYGGEGLPMDVWERRTLFWTIALGPAVIDGIRLRDDLRAGGTLHALLERVHSGHSVEWDGTNMKGSVDGTAMVASEALSRIFEDGQAYLDPAKSIWDSREWLEGGSTPAAVLRGLGLEPGDDVPDERISSIADDLIHAAKGDGVLLMGGKAALSKVVRELVDFERGPGSDSRPT